MHPVLFEIPTPAGVIPVYGFGAMLALSLLLGWWLVVRGAAREALDQRDVALPFVLSLVGGLAGARALYLLLLRLTEGSPEGSASLGQGGLSAYGAIVGGTLAAVACLRKRDDMFFRFLDLSAPAVALGTALTRLGCWLHGCDFGRPLSTEAPAWLASLGTFPRWSFDPGAALLWGQALEGAPAWNWHVTSRGLDPSTVTSLPVHPTQLYEALVGLTLFAMAAALVGRRGFRGQVGLAIGMGYGLARFGLEALRDDPGRGDLFGLSAAQAFSIVLFASSAYFYQRRARAV